MINGNTTTEGLEAIDLGLPSGTKWASCNIGAAKPEETGGYYAWGETEEKDAHNWDTYIHCDGEEDTCHDLGESICSTPHDVAHVRSGGKWRLPTLLQSRELVNFCKYEWTSINGVNGGKFTGPNGNSIFLPAGGQREGSCIENAGVWGEYWTGTQGSKDSDDTYIIESREIDDYFYDFKSDWAYFFDFADGKVYWGDYHDRCLGFLIRPVKS